MKVAAPGADASPAAAAAAAFRTEVELKDREMRAKEHKSLQGFDPGEAGSGGEDASDGEASMCAGGVFASPSSSQTNGVGAPLVRKPELKVGTVDRIQAILATGAFARLVEGPLAIADDSIPSDPMPSTEIVGKSHDSECVSPAHPKQQSPHATEECTPHRVLPPSCLAHFPPHATPGSNVPLRTPGSHDSRRLAEADETFALDSSSGDEQEDERALGGSGSSSPTPAEAPPRPGASPVTTSPAAPPAASPTASPAASPVASPAGSTEPESRSAAKALREMMQTAEVSLQQDFDGLHAFADFSGSEAEEGEAEDEDGMTEDEAAEEMRTAERRRAREAAEAAEAEAAEAAEAEAADARRRVEARRAAERRRRESVSPGGESGAEACTSPRVEAYTRTLSSNSRPPGTPPPPQRESPHTPHAAHAHAPGYVDLHRLATSQAPRGGGGACAGSDDEGTQAAAAAEAEAAAAELFRRQRRLQGGPLGPLSPERSFQSPSHWQSVADEAVEPEPSPYP